MSIFHIHLVSDSTGETVNSISRAAISQFEGFEVVEHAWSLVRTRGQVDKVIEGIKTNPGFVMYTIADKGLRKYFKTSCAGLNVPCISVLAQVISKLSMFFGVKATVEKPGKKHEMDDEYFSRVEAVNFAINHDDGHGTWDLENADIVLVGVSRSSKSPTTMYLAFKGYRAANVPYVPGVALPDSVINLKKPLIVGLSINPTSLRQIRQSRLLSINDDLETDYTDEEKIKDELLQARRLFTKMKWEHIDVTRKSVEETAAIIIQMYKKKFGLER